MVPLPTSEGRFEDHGLETDVILFFIHKSLLASSDHAFRVTTSLWNGSLFGTLGPICFNLYGKDSVTGQWLALDSPTGG